MTTEDAQPGEAAESPNEGDLGLDQFEDGVDDGGLSLEELSQTYAELINKGEDPYADAPAVAGDSAEPPPPTVVEEEEDVEIDVSPRSIVEAMLFVGHPNNEPLIAKEIAAMMRGVRPREIDQAVVELNNQYDSEGAPYHVVSIGAGYRLQLLDEFAPLRDKFHGKVKSARLTQAAIDVLAIVAYNQPITRPKVDEVRGTPSGGVLAQLVRRQLLRIDRREAAPETDEASPQETSRDEGKEATGKRKRKPRKPRLTPFYLTTDRFLDLFGLDSLQELPHSQDLEREL